MKAYISTGDSGRILHDDGRPGRRGRRRADAQVMYDMMAGNARFATLVYDGRDAAKRRVPVLRRTALLKGWPLCLAWRGRTITIFRVEAKDVEDGAYDAE